MSIIEWSERTLTNAGYSVVRSVAGPDRLTFEDESIIGFVMAYDTPQTIVETWAEEQNMFLREHAFGLRRTPGKAWNVYSIFLSSESANEAESRRLAAIEEELISTRKIAAADVTSIEDVVRALGPLLPLRAVALQHDDVLKRMRDTLRLSQQTLEGLLNESSVDELSRLFMDEQ